MRFPAKPLVTALSALLVVAAMSHGAPVRASEEPSGVGSGPKIAFDRATYDLGELQSDRKQEFAWEYRNEGDAPLEITNIRTTCGCTATVVSDKEVPPGGTGTIRITFDPADMSGSVRKTMAVSTNDPLRPRTLLTIKATVTYVETEEREPGGHPPTAGRSMFYGDCATCHAAPAAGKSGLELYQAVCAMCHGDQGGGGSGPNLRAPGYLETHDAETIGTTLSYGSVDPSMPGFIDLMGGPLTREQIDTLIDLIRGWDVLETDDTGAEPGTP